MPRPGNLPTVAEAHVRMMRDYLEYRVAELERQVTTAENRLEEARDALGMFEAKANLAAKAHDQ